MNQSVCGFAVAFYLLSFPVLSFGQSKELTRIRVSYSSIGAASLSTWVAGTPASSINMALMSV